MGSSLHTGRRTRLFTEMIAEAISDLAISWLAVQDTCRQSQTYSPGRFLGLSASVLPWS